MTDPYSETRQVKFEFVNKCNTIDLCNDNYKYINAASMTIQSSAPTFWYWIRFRKLSYSLAAGSMRLIHIHLTNTISSLHSFEPDRTVNYISQSVVRFLRGTLIWIGNVMVGIFYSSWEVFGSSFIIVMMFICFLSMY